MKQIFRNYSQRSQIENYFIITKRPSLNVQKDKKKSLFLKMGTLFSAIVHSKSLVCISRSGAKVKTFCFTKQINN